ncbi:MAG: CDC27 family protein, partial [Thermoguttaceae bacterium]
MPQAVEFDLKQAVLRNDTFGPREVKQMQDAISQDFSQYAVLRDAVAEFQAREDHTPASRVRLGVCLYLLGRYYRAIEVLNEADGGAMARYYLARCYFSRQEYPKAVENYVAAAKAGYDAGQCALGQAESLRYGGDAAAALKILDSLSGAIEQTAEYLAQRAATVSALGGSSKEVIALYERAVEVDRTHPGALF